MSYSAWVVYATIHSFHLPLPCDGFPLSATDSSGKIRTFGPSPRDVRLLVPRAPPFARPLSGILARLSCMSDCKADWSERESKLRDRRPTVSFCCGGNRPFVWTHRKYHVHRGNAISSDRGSAKVSGS